MSDEARADLNTKYQEPWFLSNDNDSEEWVITDGIETFPITEATPAEFGIAVKGTVERGVREAEVTDKMIERAVHAVLKTPWIPTGVAPGLTGEEYVIREAGLPLGMLVTIVLDAVLGEVPNE